MIYSLPSLNAACSVASWRSVQPKPLDGHRRENVKGVPKKFNELAFILRKLRVARKPVISPSCAIIDINVFQ
jgi:hypothetical protein